MTKHILKKNRRRYKLLPSFLSIFFYKERTIFVKKFKFSNGCNYTLDNGDQLDVNKLFGFTFNTLPDIKKRKAPHHITSYRFGWRYVNNNIEILSYEYKNYIRQKWYSIANIEIDKWYTFILIISDNNVEYSIYDDTNNKIGKFISSIDKVSLFGHKLGFYFGGNQVSPNNMIIYEK